MLRTRRPRVRLLSARPDTGCKSAARQPASMQEADGPSTLTRILEMWPRGRRRCPAKTEALPNNVRWFESSHLRQNDARVAQRQSNALTRRRSRFRNSPSARHLAPMVELADTLRLGRSFSGFESRLWYQVTAASGAIGRHGKLKPCFLRVRISPCRPASPAWRKWQTHLP